MEHKPPTPVFIFSLPRSGSTLLQRILATSNKIVTTSEPWILLPLLYMRKEEGAYAEYGHRASASAVSDFIAELPDGEHDFSSALRDMTLQLYTLACQKQPSATYFLDKTPRYHLVCEQIVDLFPNAKFIFLWRNPLAVAASIIDTFGRGNWQLYDYKVDLFDGLEELIKCHQQCEGKELTINFEDLVTSTEVECKRILEFLDLPGDSIDISGFSSVELKGRMGDPTGTKMYKNINSTPLEKWVNTLSNPIRKHWAKRYIHWLGEDRLKHMGYSYEDLLTTLDNTSTNMNHIAIDSVRLLFGTLQSAFELRILTQKLKRPWRKTHGHT